MTKRRIRYIGDPVLRKKAAAVKKIKPEIRKLIEDMFETMEAANGVGLAAPQIGISKQVIVVDVPGAEGVRDRFGLINPRVIRCIGPKESHEEGCLSMPGVYADVSRAEGVVVAGEDEKGRKVEITATALLARCLMHEIDHLNGVLFIDHVGIAEKDAKGIMEEFLASR